MSDKIFIIGATGDVGSKLDTQVTLYVRNTEKAKNLFAQNDGDLKIVQGDYATTDIFEQEIAGHTRMFILTAPDAQMPDIKGKFAKMAYSAGVRQIVDISSHAVNLPYRSGFLNVIHREGEERILAEKGKEQFYVALRPAPFFTAHIMFDSRSIKTNQELNTIRDLDIREDFSSSTDVAELASIVLIESIEKHANCVYTMVGDSLTANERAGAFSKLLGKTIKGNTTSTKSLYDHIIAVGYPHGLAIDFVQQRRSQGPTHYYGLILGRPPQTFSEWLLENNNLSHFQ